MVMKAYKHISFDVFDVTASDSCGAILVFGLMKPEEFVLG